MASLIMADTTQKKASFFDLFRGAVEAQLKNRHELVKWGNGRCFLRLLRKSVYFDLTCTCQATVNLMIVVKRNDTSLRHIIVGIRTGGDWRRL